MGGRRTTGAGKERKGRGEERVNGPVSLFPQRNYHVEIIEAGWQDIHVSIRHISLLYKSNLTQSLRFIA